MCIMLLDDRTDSTDRVPRKVLERCREKNSDGLGLMYAKGGKLHIWRSLDNFEGLWNLYTSARDDQLKVAVHFRRTTKGVESQENCHPFLIGDKSDGFAFMHNGTIKIADGLLPEGVSDTRFFRDTVLNDLPGSFLSNTLLRRMIQKSIDGSRLLFMDSKGDHSIINAKTGFWWDGKGDYLTKPKKNAKGVWFSKIENRRYFIDGDTYTRTGYTIHHDANCKCYHCKTPPPRSAVRKAEWDDLADNRWLAEDAYKGLDKPNVVFLYGDVHEDPTLAPDYLTPSEDVGDLLFCQLWAITNEAGVQAGALKTSEDYRIRGRLFDIHPDKLLKASARSVYKALEDFDTYFGYDKGDVAGSPFYRVRLPIYILGHGMILAWTYIVNPDVEINDFIAPVPHGEWSRWLDRGDKDFCRECGNQDLIEATSYDKDGNELTPMLYCSDCKREWVDSRNGNETYVDDDVRTSSVAGQMHCPQCGTGVQMYLGGAWCGVCAVAYDHDTKTGELIHVR